MYDAKRNPKSIVADPRSAWQRLSTFTLGLALIALCSGCAAPSHAAQNAQAAPAQSTPDALIRLCEQHWTLNPDGSTVYREKTHVQLNSDRVYGEFGDPRIFYNKDADKVEVLAARVKRADGGYVDLADYSTVEVAPDDTAGWPAFGNLTQKVQVMGGLEPGCVVEREHKITSKPGAHPYLEADIHIDSVYPVVSRIVTVTIPNGTELLPIVTGIAEDNYAYSFEQATDGKTVHRWEFNGLEGQPGEPQSLPWRECGVRLAFTTAPGADAWIKEQLSAIDRAASESPLITKLAQDWTKDALTAADKLSALQDKFAETFNFVDFNVAWRPATQRPASETLSGCYGLPAESAAALLALARAAGVALQPALLVNDGVWDDKAPQSAMVAEYVLISNGVDGAEIWHPQSGRLYRDAHWAGYTALYFSGDKLKRLALPLWENPDDSRCIVTGAITISPDKNYSGKINVRTSGLFVAPRQLQSNSQQKRALNRVVGAVLPQVKIKDFTLKMLTNDLFEAEANVESDGALENLHDLVQMTLAQNSPALNEVNIPVNYSRRLGPARLDGPFDEQIELSVAWPEAWQTVAAPAALTEVAGDWGVVSQTIAPTDHGLTLQRRVRVNQRDLAPEFVDALRKPLQELKTAYTYTLLWKPEAK